MNNSLIQLIAFILVLIGALNWGLIAWFNFNLVATLCGEGLASIVVYSLVAISAIYWIIQTCLNQGIFNSSQTK